MQEVDKEAKYQEAVGLVGRCSQGCSTDTPSKHPNHQVAMEQRLEVPNHPLVILSMVVVFLMGDKLVILLELEWGLVASHLLRLKLPNMATVLVLVELVALEALVALVALEALEALAVLVDFIQGRFQEQDMELHPRPLNMEYQEEYQEAYQEEYREEYREEYLGGYQGEYQGEYQEEYQEEYQGDYQGDYQCIHQQLKLPNTD